MPPRPDGQHAGENRVLPGRPSARATSPHCPAGSACSPQSLETGEDPPPTLPQAPALAELRGGHIGWWGGTLGKKKAPRRASRWGLCWGEDRGAVPWGQGGRQCLPPPLQASWTLGLGGEWQETQAVDLGERCSVFTLESSRLSS